MASPMRMSPARPTLQGIQRRSSLGMHASPSTSSMGRRPSVGGYGSPTAAATPTMRRSYSNRRGVEEAPHIRTIDLKGRREQFPRPPGDISAECVYRWESDVDSSSPTKSPAQRREETMNRDRSASRQFLWPTMDSVITKPPELVSSLPVPLATVCCPFADGAGDSASLPLSDVGSEEPLRCTRCRSYINPYFRWVGRGTSSLQCNMCSHVVEVPEAFREDMERAGQCADEDNHPELAFGSVDFVAPDHYDVDRPADSSEPALCIAVETSAEAVRSGLLSSSVGAIRRLIECAEGHEDEPLLCRRLCVVTFDEAVHFFSPTRSGRFSAVTMRDVDDPYIPVAPASLFVDPRKRQGREMLEGLLEHLQAQLAARLAGPAAGAAPEAGGVAGGAALRVAVEMLSSIGGGDVVMFHGSSPNLGVGALRSTSEPEEPASPPTSPMARMTSRRSSGFMTATASGPMSPTATGTGAASPPKRGSVAVGVLAPPKQQAAFYEEIQGLCVRGRVAVSCVTAVVFGEQQAQPLDVGTLQWLPWRTGGDTLHLPTFTTASAPLLNDTLHHWVEKMQASAYGCVVKLRASKGMFCKSLVAPWPAAASSEDSSAFEVPRLSPDTSFAFCLEAEPEEEIDDPYYRREVVKRQLFAQVAVLYTSGKGERLLRVHTCMMQVVPTMRAVYAGVSLAPLLALLIKQVVIMALGNKPDSKTLARDSLLEFCLQVMASYTRHNHRGDMSADTMVLSRRLQLLPLYILGARKLLYMVTSGNMDQDCADEFLRRLLRMPVHSVLASLYPRIYALQPGATFDRPELPRAGFASKDYLISGSAPAYLIANAFGTWFYDATQEDRDEASPSVEPQAGSPCTEGAPAADPERTPEGRATRRAELWKVAEALAQRIREGLAPGPVWMPMCELPRLKSAGEGSLDWNTKVFFSALFVEDEGVTEMEYPEWMIFLHKQMGRML